jgi:hypothetical protein
MKKRAVKFALKRAAAPQIGTLFAKLLAHHGLPLPEAEHRFCERRWRFDYAWPAQKVALEVEGGIYTRGRHVRPKGFLNDMKKYNRATVLGWRLVRCTPSELCGMETLEMLKEILR